MNVCRPPSCFEANCECVSHIPRNDAELKQQLEQGGSWVCIGRMKNKLIFTYDKVTHDNEYYYCWYTPLKGHVKFQVNRDDLWIELNLIKWLAKVEKWRMCDECGASAFGLAYAHQDTEGKTHCAYCHCAKNPGTKNPDALPQEDKP